MTLSDAPGRVVADRPNPAIRVSNRMPAPLESEWLHLRRKRMPWILLALLPVISLLAFWLVAVFGLGPAPAELQMSQSYIDPSAGRISITITCADVINDAYLSDVTTLSQDLQRTILVRFERFRLATCEPFVVIRPNALHLVPPLGIEIGIKLMYEIVVIIVMILGASVMGWQLKSKPSHMIDIVGHKRWQVVAAKALLVVILGAAGMLAGSSGVWDFQLCSLMDPTTSRRGIRVSRTMDWSG